ncbi:MAG: TVP38/TMEM64 family protein [Alphaproteobacteria bacterium]|nr:TVP38/TMEM64 family protein [Alphaproteobacteria bacterium]
MTVSKEKPAHSGATDRRAMRRRIALLIGLAIIAATGLIWGFALLADMPIPGFELSAEEAAATMRSWGMWGVAIIIGLMILHAFVPFPAEFCALAAGMVYGTLWGTVYVWIGAMLGALLSFGLARWLGRPFVEAMVARRYRSKLDDWTEQQGASTLLISRFIPVIAFNLINYAAGLTNMSWFTFTWATGVGILPLTALMVAMGDQMRSLAWWHWAAISAVAVAAWIVLWAVRRRRESRA